MATHTQRDPAPATDGPDPLQLLDEREVAELLRVPLQTLRNHRSQRRGIPFVRLGRAVRYRRSDVERFVNGGAVAMSATGEGNTRA